MARRVHLEKVEVGEVALSEAEAHHLRNVLRLAEGADVEVFDDQGRSGRGVLRRVSGSQVIVQVEQATAPPAGQRRLVVAAAVPKGNRADWMIEKLSELGTTAFVPLMTARSVVHPEGAGKRQRWQRLAAESAKQCRRTGVMEIGELTDVGKSAMQGSGIVWYLSPSGRPIGQALADLGKVQELTVLVGPEGGWTESELVRFATAGWTGVCLTDTILRVETAAVAAAAIIACDEARARQQVDEAG